MKKMLALLSALHVSTLLAQAAAPAPAAPLAKLLDPPSIVDRQGEADTAGEFAGTYQSEDGSRNSAIRAAGDGCTVLLTGTDGKLALGPGLVIGHYLGTGSSPSGKARFSAYLINNTGTLAGQTAFLTGLKVKARNETFQGPVFPTDGDAADKYAGGTYASGKLRLTIKNNGNNTYSLTRSDGGQGIGFRMDQWLWVGWDGNLAVYSFPDNGTDQLQVNALTGADAQPMEWPRLQTKTGDAALAVTDKISGAIPMNNPPVDLPPAANPPADNPPAQPAQPAQPAGKGVVVPPVGPQVDLAVARKKLRDNMQVQIDEFMKFHNDARAEVGAPPLVWDPQLAAFAQDWADQLAAKGDFKHRPNNKYGENLAGYMPQTGMRPVHGAKMWYDEIKDYHGEAISDTNYKAFGHYTQMVWAKTTKVGFGIAMAADGMAILCANYEIAGNMIGEKPY